MKIDLISVIALGSLIVTSLILAGCISFPYFKQNNPNLSFTYQANKVIDGDSIELSDGSIIRYLGINAPEKDQLYYNESSQFNLLLVQNQDLRLEFDQKKEDQYGRLLAYVFAGDTFVNLEIIRQGWAIAFTDPQNKKYAELFQKAQSEAQQLQVGFWKLSPHELKIDEVQYDAPGNDEKNLNGEWIKISNIGSKPMRMKGFILQDESLKQFSFPDIHLQPSGTIAVYTGSGKDNAASLYWGLSLPIWNNKGDTVFLFDDEYRLIDSYHWSS